MKVYGPYTRKSDGRKHVILYDAATNTRRTISYPKFLMEQKLGRALTDNETVDHIDRDFTNDSLSNLTVRERGTHSSLDATRVQVAYVSCVWCGFKFDVSVSQYNRNRRLGKAGPFCSKSCSGEYGVKVQNNKQEKLPVPDEMTPVYYKLVK